jgi:hypothetical protein
MKQFFLWEIFRIFVLVGAYNYRWLTLDRVEIILNQLKDQEALRALETFRGDDRRNSTPLITGDGFRALAKSHVCDETNRCRFDPLKVTPGSCIFVKSDMFEFFVTAVVDRIKVPYILLSHNGDISAPDGQDDAPQIRLPLYNTTTKLLEEK